MSPPLALIVSTAPVPISSALIWLPVTCAMYTRPSGPVRRPLAPNSRLGALPAINAPALGQDRGLGEGEAPILLRCHGVTVPSTLSPDNSLHDICSDPP